MKTIIEPFKIKMIEPLKLTTQFEREAILRKRRSTSFKSPPRKSSSTSSPTRAPRRCRLSNGPA